jgi:hypothetical protein
MAAKSLLCGAVLAAVLAGTTAAVAAQSPGSGLVCVPIQTIKGTPAIDDKTILLELNGHQYKRVDLIDFCPDLTFKGFSFATSTEDLCSSNGLRVNEIAGAVCMIKDIVDITPDQAMALKKQSKQ